MPVAIFSATVASAATLSSEVDLGRHWDYCWLAIQSMTSNSQLYIKAATISGGDYRRVLHPLYNTATIAAPPTFTIASSVTSAMVPLPTGLRYVKVEQTATADSGQFYTIVCSGS